MLRLIVDENVREAIPRGVPRRLPDANIVFASDVRLRRTPDPIILEWAAANGRLVATQDEGTMPGFAYERTARGLPMPGVVVIPEGLPIGVAVEELTMLVACSRDDEWEGQVIFLPL